MVIALQLRLKRIKVEQKCVVGFWGLWQTKLTKQVNLNEKVKHMKILHINKIETLVIRDFAWDSLVFSSKTFKDM